MAGELLVGCLRAGTTVEIHDHIQASILGPPDETVEEIKAATGIVLAIVNEILTDPETNGDADGVKAQAGDEVDVVASGPGVPVFAEGLIGGVLAEGLDAGPLVVAAAAAHACPGVGGHPWLDDELRAEVDTADLVFAGEPSLSARCVDEICFVSLLCPDWWTGNRLFTSGVGRPGPGGGQEQGEDRQLGLHLGRKTRSN